MNDKVTIDLDFVDYVQRDRIIFKILGMSCCEAISCLPSFCKGWHLIITCRDANCNLCRLVFDDSNRFSMDSRRKTEEQNVLWDTARSLKGVSVKPGTSRHSPEPQSRCRSCKVRLKRGEFICSLSRNCPC
jgi:hypothetical protein